MFVVLWLPILLCLARINRKYISFCNSIYLLVSFDFSGFSGGNWYPSIRCEHINLYTNTDLLVNKRLKLNRSALKKCICKNRYMQSIELSRLSCIPLQYSDGLQFVFFRFIFHFCYSQFRLCNMHSFVTICRKFISDYIILSKSSNYDKVLNSLKL